MNPPKRSNLPPDLAARLNDVAPKRSDYPGRFYVCAQCGQTVDRRDLAQVHHHDDQPHAPM